ncbi:prolactin family 2, subfamily C, member 1 precursor [Rattus norvegicus]|uniref:Growth hormone d4 n=1 Tax=Rattus norvegicus TaxID=10116 RepID=Q1KZI0_RAT|nr:prolactin family 2, subfamily C, member 1 precursor [Rattus norvegicus]ABC59296.1 proliferin [Rattus norvegicus]CDW51444.1 TPA: growth hormone d4 [Rattus norvegicus]|eukprot:NP_001037736.1 Prolactin family 2, subfamily c, member 1 precursor [Rattus norvegicus]
MQLSLTQPSSWILLLLVTNLFLWKNVASVPFCAMRNVRCFMFLEDMFDLAGSMSHNISIEVSEMFTEFEKHYAKVPGLKDKSLTRCHTTSLPIPENKEQAKHTHYGALLKSAHMVLKAWKSPLNDLVRQISTLKNIPDTIISKATDIKLKINSVEQGVNSIINRMLQNGDEERNYPAWSSLPIFKSNDEDASIRSFYGMISCLDNDCKKVDIYLNVLKCYVLQMDNC